MPEAGAWPARPADLPALATPSGVQVAVAAVWALVRQDAKPSQCSAARTQQRAACQTRAPLIAARVSAPGLAAGTRQGNGGLVGRVAPTIAAEENTSEVICCDHHHECYCTDTNDLGPPHPRARAPSTIKGSKRNPLRASPRLASAGVGRSQSAFFVRAGFL